MAKRTLRPQQMSSQDVAAASNGAISSRGSGGEVQTFTFGDPEPVLDRRELMDLMECVTAGRWYEPPVPLDGLARAYRASPHHSSAIQLKRNLVVASFEPSPWLSEEAFAALVLDDLVFGNCYLEERRNVLGGAMRYHHVLAKYTRRGLEEGQFFYVPGYRLETEFAPGSVGQVRQADLNQEIYGVPEYLSALQSALLNENATLFRRRYFLNGSHAGYILHATGDIDENDVDSLREALKRSKGPGNFRNLFVHSPNGKEGSIKVIPVTEVGAKDEFLGIKNATRDDVLAAHRTPPSILGIVPAQGSSGFGNPLQAVDMFHRLEIVPIQTRLLRFNAWAGRELVRFRPYSPLSVIAAQR